ncbi:hypothetical protein [Haloarcula nitratireducens]|uniref:Uncharacterized protein n=1 Tax=Haloarcula nitratireducens TaxID=2487749 RepID=A0AAW4PFT9_9EURY|nr:hypothetical protein [Halomicroarcula nitratireducens]MBX0296723.1 hypothetical protein [Halomicroarcula nitratireducens]
MDSSGRAEQALATLIDNKFDDDYLQAVYEDAFTVVKALIIIDLSLFGELRSESRRETHTGFPVKFKESRTNRSKRHTPRFR